MRRSRCAGSRSGSTGRCAACCASSRRAPPGARAPTWQVLAAAVAVGLVIGGFAVVARCDARRADGADRPAVPVRDRCCALVALHQALAGPRASGAPASGRHPRRDPDWLLPVYTVLVPLLREANVLPGLVRSLRALDYPAGQARDLPGAGGRRHRDPGGGAGAGAARQLPHAGGAGPGAAHQAQGLELRPAVRARRLRRGLRRRGPAAARPAAPRLGGVPARAAGARLPAGAAQHLQSPAELVHPPVHHRIFRAVRCHPAGAGAAAAAGAAGRHVEPFSACHARSASAPGTPTT